MDLFTQYSLWWIIPCLLLGMVYAFVLYRKDIRLADTASWLKSLLAVLRALVVGLIAFLLLGPFFKFIERETQKPVVLIAQDNSASLLLSPDSTLYTEAYAQQMQTLTEVLAEDFEVQTYSFDKTLSNGLSFDYNGKQTDIAMAITEMAERNINRNVGAVILASDGIYNRGMSPAHVASSTGFAYYTIAMGDTTVKRDVLVENVAHNRLAYLGNDFPLEVVVKADRYKGKQSILTVRQAGAELFRKTIDIQDEAYITTVPVVLSASQVGRQRYDVSLSTLPDELSTRNNSQSIYIDVLDSRQKVLMLYDGPHPDVAAVRSAVEGNENYEVIVNLADGFHGDLKAYDLIILHGLPSARYAIDNIMAEAKTDKIPVWVLAGLQTKWASLKSQGFGVDIQVKGGNNVAEASPSLEREFSLFTLDPGLGQAASQWPPLHTAFAEFSAQPSARTLFSQRIGVVATNQPMWVFSEVDGHKTSLTVGEGLWRWRMASHAQQGDHSLFDGLISRTVQFLATKEDRRQFRVYAKDRFDEDQRIVLEAELYNQSYELVNEAEVTVVCTDDEGNDFEFVFSRTQSAYYLDAGRLPAGRYSYRARVNFEGKESSATGGFLVAPIQVESVRTTADHQLLYKLAEESGGRMVYPSEVSSLAAMLQSADEIVPVMYSTQQVRELIESRWLFFLFLGLLSIEWFVRKYQGAY